MIKLTASITRKFYSYQKHRFPVFILILSLFPAILSSAAVVGVNISPGPIISALFLSILYLLHIRIGDEHRDFDHDTIHHKTRPIQRGQISRDELRKIDVTAITIFLFLSAFSGTLAFILGILMLTYSYLAEKEFFIGERLRKYFLLYNFINIIQMALLQVLIYVIFAEKIPLTYLVILHFIFTFIGTGIFEFLRKLMVPGTDGTGKDTYTWHLGFDNAILAYIILASLDLFFFFQIASSISPNKNLWIFISLILFMISVIFALMCRVKKTFMSSQLMQLSYMVIYSILNLAIYFLKFH